MGVPSVTAALIVLNEERFLGGCLDSLTHSVDDVVVVDTGSTDQSIEIARQFGARVFHFKWIGDFAAARNYCLELCRTDWALYIDADERLSNSSGASPIGEMINPHWLVADVLFQPKENYTRYRLTRLLRVDARLRFLGAIHETMVPSLERIPNGVDSVGLTAIQINHLGYDGDLTMKHSRNLPLLKRCVVEYPQRIFYWFHLTETLLALNNFEGAYEAGLRGISAAGQKRTEKNRADAAMICQILGAAMLNRQEDPLSILDQGLALHPGNFGIRLTLAQRELQFGDPLKALKMARSLQAVNPDSIEPELIAYDRDIFGRRSVELQVASLARLGRLKEAAALVAQSTSLLTPSSSMPTCGVN